MCHPGSVCTAMLSYLVYSLIFKLGDKHKLGAKLYRRYLDDTFKDKAFQSHDHNTGGDYTCPESHLQISGTSEGSGPVSSLRCDDAWDANVL